MSQYQKISPVDIFNKKVERIAKYKNMFEQANLIEEKEQRKTKLANLLEEYTSDNDIKNLASFWSRASEVEKIGELRDLECDIKASIEKTCCEENSDELQLFLRVIQDTYQKSSFNGYLSEAIRRKHELTPEDLKRVITI